MAKKPKPKKKAEKPQSERFKETARTIEVGESGNLFERMFRKVVPPKRKKAVSS